MDRPEHLRQIEQQFAIHPVLALLGPRQCGKTTLARMVEERFDGPVTRFDLEDPIDLTLLTSPRLALQDLRGLVVIDEIQRSPELFPVLRVLVDRPDNPARFLILGSASRDLIRQSSETLAGRIGYIELTPFSLSETGIESQQRLWLRGGFPRSFLANNDTGSTQWRKDYVATFLERDLPSLGITIPPQSLRRFWMMLAHYHGQIVNFSELGRSFGVADTTVRRYLDILEATFMVRLLMPWYENVSKRQVKAPKLYLRDSGLFHTLMGIPDSTTLARHPKLGASWEGFAIEEIIRRHRATSSEVYFWAAHGGGEVDLFLLTDQGRIGYEIKYTDQPRATRSMYTAMEVLNLTKLSIIYPGDREFPLTENIRAVGLNNLLPLQCVEPPL
ncbi:MAG: ATP-binding protein [Rhodocyclaceae bacterium]|nr:ATP-binding protein [Rhodocyclaceae bacterium]